MARFYGRWRAALAIIFPTLSVLNDAAGFLSGDWRDILAIAGVSITFFGIAIAIRQIQRAASSAESARTAADSARYEITRNLQLADLSSATRLIGEINALVRSAQLDAASLRLNDLRELMVQIRASRLDLIGDAGFQETLAQVASLEKALLRHHYGSGRPINPVVVHTRLREVADFLNALATAARLQGGGTNVDS